MTFTKINDNAYSFTVGPRTWYFSYQTCVAYEELGPKQLYPVDHKATGLAHARRVRRDRNYSTTTAKHMNFMGVSEWPKVDDATFERLAGGES